MGDNTPLISSLFRPFCSKFLVDNSIFFNDDSNFLLMSNLYFLSEFWVVSVAYFLFKSASEVTTFFLLECLEYKMGLPLVAMGELLEIELELSDDFLDPDRMDGFCCPFN